MLHKVPNAICYKITWDNLLPPSLLKYEDLLKHLKELNYDPNFILDFGDQDKPYFISEEGDCDIIPIYKEDLIEHLRNIRKLNIPNDKITKECFYKILGFPKRTSFKKMIGILSDDFKFKIWELSQKKKNP